MPKREGRVRALLLRVFFPNALLCGKRVFGHTSARLVHWRSPAFSTNVCWLLLNPAPCLFHVWQPDSQRISGQEGHKMSNFCKSPAQRDSRTASEAESWGQDKRGPTLAPGWARDWGSGPCLRRAAKQEGLTTRVQLLVYEQWLCFCLVADPAALTVESGTTCCHKAVEAKNRGTCLDVTNLLCHPWQRFTQEVWQRSQ